MIYERKNSYDNEKLDNFDLRPEAINESVMKIKDTSLKKSKNASLSENTKPIIRKPSN